MTREQFINHNLTIIATSVALNEVTFNNINKIVISDNIQTDVDNSLFFINGVHIYNSMITSILDSGSNLVVTFDTGSMGHNLESIDKIIGIGKFNSV